MFRHDYCIMTVFKLPEGKDGYEVGGSARGLGRIKLLGLRKFVNYDY